MKHLDDTLVKVCLVASYVAIAIDCIGLIFRVLNDGSYFIFLTVLYTLSLILLPVYLVSLIGFITAVIRIRKENRALLIASSLNLALIAISILAQCIFAPSAKGMEKNFLRHEQDFERVICYTRDAMDEGCRINVTFGGGNRIKHLCVWNDNDIPMSSFNAPKENEADSLLSMIGITREELCQIRDLLKATGCRSISTPDLHDTPVFKFSYRTDSPYGYIYEIYDDNLSDDEIQKLDDCSRIFYNRRVCFRYRSPMWDYTDFPGKEKYLKKRAESR